MEVSINLNIKKIFSMHACRERIPALEVAKKRCKEDTIPRIHIIDGCIYDFSVIVVTSLV